MIHPLTWKIATQMRILYARGERTIPQLAALYGTDSETIRGILEGETFQQFPENLAGAL